MAQRVEVAPVAPVAPPNRRIRTPQRASVVLTVPAHKDYVVIVRSAVAQLAACSGYTLQQVTDLRLAVNEACALLVGGLGVIECRAEVRADAGSEVLRVTVTAPAAGGFDVPDAPDTDGLGWNLMTALVDALAWAQDGVTARVSLEKRRGLPAGPAVPTG
ncbi:ATP-binding protein [Catenulispora rubra]|uniref:ATP-binding protein n=1 Tax=Catenulispora rubra TaxID=280293 RepID=UPI0018922BED|nr:ATP-binding protein [Catenulispora rubra]